MYWEEFSNCFIFISELSSASSDQNYIFHKTNLTASEKMMQIRNKIHNSYTLQALISWIKEVS